MVPLNPPRLINVIVEAPEPPCVKVREDGLAEMVKLGELLKEAVWTFSGSGTRPPLVIVTQMLSLLVVVQPVWYPIVVLVVLPTVLYVIEKRRPVTGALAKGPTATTAT
jgi:hypothetical protein